MYIRSPRLLDVALGMVALAHLTWWIDVAAYVTVGTMPFS